MTNPRTEEIQCWKKGGVKEPLFLFKKNGWSTTDFVSVSLHPLKKKGEKNENNNFLDPVW